MESSPSSHSTLVAPSFAVKNAWKVELYKKMVGHAAFHLRHPLEYPGHCGVIQPFQVRQFLLWPSITLHATARQGRQWVSLKVSADFQTHFATTVKQPFKGLKRRAVNTADQVLFIAEIDAAQGHRPGFIGAQPTNAGIQQDP